MRTSLRTTGIAIAALLFLTTAAQAQIVERVSVGGHDIENSDDRNFSLIALKNAAGVVRGQYQDAITGYQGIHAVVSNLAVLGNVAVIGGVITQSTVPGYDVGEPVCALVQDDEVNGDKISFSYQAAFAACLNAAANAQAYLQPVENGQVSIHVQ